ncbi:hypothetical protein niasHS_010076 [Heterodera schachtii]|uniref:Tudor domain-containing protein n=1 Tax=Heterodera schachtii TaxID=97005 RepID=A0ABD2J349_HETSC
MSTASESGSDKIVFQKNVTGRGSQVLDDAEFVKMYDRSTLKTLNTSSANDNAQSNQQKEQVQKWKVGDQCMALYEVDGKWYPAKIEQISPVKNTCTVSYIGYDQKAILKLEDILGESDVEAADDHGDEREAEGTSGTTTKIADNDVKKDAFPIPDLCPPPPPSMFGKIAVAGNEKEALTNMLMSWYMSGYHTGFYQGVMHEKTTRQKPK